MNFYNFNDYQVENGKNYNGANGRKICIYIDGDMYLVKCSPKKMNSFNGSYSSSVYSEYISCHIIESIGLDVQKTILGTWKDVKTGKEYDAVGCKDFAGFDNIVYDFGTIKNGYVDSNGYGTELSEVLDIIEQQDKVDPVKLKEFFWDMFIADALVGNFDRHNGNWALLYNLNDKSYKIAPIFDCGSCLYPQPNAHVR